jgi:1-acyl-sn-glycerol-3-phosphate acyltransferase
MFVGLFGGISVKATWRGYFDAIRPDAARLRDYGFVSSCIAVATISLASIVPNRLIEFEEFSFVSSLEFRIAVIGLSLLSCVLAWGLLYREAMENVIEVIMWPMYRIRAQGPGLAALPRTGPMIVIANHTAWLDPIWLGKIIPRPLTAMMTSKFYDLPILHFLMTKVAGAIRVQESTFRRDVPEIDVAIAVLDSGGCLVIFPEGAMRRKLDVPLRPFGQGIWRILHERPNTPVLVCWIEGGWGSYTSYAGGPPTRNKRLDWRRPIGIAVETPLIVDPSILDDQRATRTYLMEKCLAARSISGLEPLDLEEHVEADAEDVEES